MPVAYIGCLGPGERLERMLKDLVAGGRHVEPEDLERIHGPAGIDLGADGPTEIAWSVLSEILAVRRGAGAGFLVHRKGPSELRRLP
jgi:xanthine/CO dehydrogenase XdhC/CoxF family maturation factor